MFGNYFAMLHDHDTVQIVAGRTDGFQIARDDGVYLPCGVSVTRQRINVFELTGGSHAAAFCGRGVPRIHRYAERQQGKA